MYNPYYPNANPFQSQLTIPTPHTEIPRVTGEESARAYQLGPNSSVILLDTTNPLVWFVMTDASGYKTVVPYTITPYTPEKPIDASDVKAQLDDFGNRLSKLEERMNGRGQPNYGNAGKKQPATT